MRALGTFLLVIVSGVAAAQGIPSLRDYDDETRQSMELACVSTKTKGPAAYGACLNQQIASLQSSPGIANLSRHDSETRHTTLPAPRSGGTNSGKSRSGGTAAHSGNPMSQFATKSIITQREDQKYEIRGIGMTGAMLVLIFVFLLFYFLPTIVASSRKRHNTGAIFVLNLFLGWSLIGWVVSLVWAVSSDQPPVARAELPNDSQKTPWIGE